MVPGTVALTGATGFIGSHLVDRLLTAGVPVRALARRMRAARAGVEWVVGDLSTPDALAALVKGTHAVVNCAGAVRGATWPDFRTTNVEGSVAVARCAHEAGVRLLQISSLAAREPALSHYARSKREAEGAVVGCGGRVTVLRPPAVYGAGDRELKPLLDLMWRGRAVVPRHSGRFSLIHVDDLVDAVVAWLGAPLCPAGPFEIDDGHARGYSWHEVVDAAERVSGRAISVLRLPKLVVAVAGSLNGFVGRVGIGRPMLTRGKVNELYFPDWVCRTGGFEHATGWRPRVGLDAGLARTFPCAGAPTT